MWPASKPVCWVSYLGRDILRRDSLVSLRAVCRYLAGHVPEWCREAFDTWVTKTGSRIPTGFELGLVIHTTSGKLKLAILRTI